MIHYDQINQPKRTRVTVSENIREVVTLSRPARPQCLVPCLRLHSHPDMAVYTLLVLSACILVASGFNLATQHAIVVDGTHNSYFGYATNFRKASSSSGQQLWLIVGAPRGKSNHYNHKLINETGAVYQCKVEDGLILPCSQIVIDSTADSRSSISNLWDKKDNAWIGGTIAVEEKLDGKLVVCGFRLMKQNPVRRLMPGVCYYWLSYTTGRLPEFSRELSVLGNTFRLGLSQIGFSAHFIQNTSDLLVGAPGMNSWEGAMLQFEADDGVFKWQNGHGFKRPPIPEPSKFIDAGSFYFGYAVGSGRFHKVRNRISYVASMPKAGQHALTGEVYIVDCPSCKNWNLLTTLRGQQMGESFGSSLLAMDINNDGIDDLIVGAPLHSYYSEGEIFIGCDHGKVYVFINKGEARFELDQDLRGLMKSEARFGTALANLGDINKDGFLDLAVGAPYEDGVGAIYIYHGHAKGYTKTHAQRISASDIRHGLLGFGISITSGIDIDDNSFNDVVIGSYDSSHVVVIKSYPIIEFHAKINSTITRLDVNASEFTVEACLYYTSQAAVGQLPTLDTRVRLRVDSTLGRAVFKIAKKNDIGGQMFLRRNNSDCWKREITLKENNNQVIQPLEIEMTYELAYNPLKDDHVKDKEFCPFCAITDPNKLSSVKIKIPFANGCESSDVCRSDLKVWARFLNTKDKLILGSKASISIVAYVTNKGDPAYLTKLSIVMCPETRLVRIPQLCYIQNSQEAENAMETVVCDLGNPFIYSSEVQRKGILQFDIDVSSVSNNQSELVFNFKTWSANEEKNPEDNTFSLPLNVSLAADITITGKSKPFSLLTKKDGLKQIDVFHVYEVVNEGPSHVDFVRIQIWVPVGVDFGSIIFLQLPDPYVLLSNQQIFPCEVDRNFLKGAALSPSKSENNFDNANSGRVDVSQIHRHKRDILDSSYWSPTLAPQNRTMFVNCTNHDSPVICLYIECIAGPFAPKVDLAKVNIQMNVTLKDIEMSMEGHDLLQLTSSGRISIVDAAKYIPTEPNRPDVATIHTYFLGEVATKMSSWILPLSIAIGFLLLMVIVKSLVKLGFFQRKDLERLQSLKESAAEEDFGPIDSMDFDDDCSLNNDNTLEQSSTIDDS